MVKGPLYTVFTSTTLKFVGICGKRRLGNDGKPWCWHQSIMNRISISSTWYPWIKGKRWSWHSLGAYKSVILCTNRAEGRFPGTGPKWRVKRGGTLASPFFLSSNLPLVPPIRVGHLTPQPYTIESWAEEGWGVDLRANRCQLYWNVYLFLNLESGFLTRWTLGLHLPLWGS